MHQWKNIFLSFTGSRHLEATPPSPCQDAVLCQENDRFWVAALADGLGSKKNSQLASDAVTRSIIAYVLENAPFLFSDETSAKDQLCQCAINAILQASEEATVPVSSMDCTLLLACMDKDTDTLLCAQIGDGAICLIGSQEATLFHSPVKTVTNLTDTVMTMQNDLSAFHLAYYDASEIEGIVLTSDGLDDEIYSCGHVRQEVQDYLKVFETEKEDAVELLSEKLKLVITENRNLTDDISICLLRKMPLAPISLPDNPTWLCKCGNRNEIFETRCSKCKKLFFNLYTDDYRDLGGKIPFFQKLNHYDALEREYLSEMLSEGRDLDINLGIAILEKINATEDALKYQETSENEDLSEIKEIPKVMASSPSKCRRSKPSRKKNRRRKKLKRRMRKTLF